MRCSTPKPGRVQVKQQEHEVDRLQKMMENEAARLKALMDSMVARAQLDRR